MRSKAFLVILLFLIWALLSGWYYVCKIKQKCPSSVVSAKTEVPSFSFDRSSSEPILSENIDDFKLSLKNKLGETDLLQIIGLYDAQETNHTSFDNLGLARAAEVQQVLTDFDEERISLSSEETTFGSELLGLDGVKFKIITNNEFVQETDFGAVLYFEENLIETELPAKLEAYLMLLSNESKGNVIDVVGHTDDTDGEGENFELGLQRANMIRDILISKGINPDNITANSKGQTEPIADNSTEKGRSKNRRVEILIN